MSITLTKRMIDKLKQLGVSTLSSPGAVLPGDVMLEPPCSLKWMDVHHSLHMGAFSYAVSGFFFGCRIGRYCSFGEEVQVGRHAHSMHWASTSPFFYTPYKHVIDLELPDSISLVPHEDFVRSTPPVVAKTTSIGNDVWIGHGAFILPGVSIGDGAVIAAQAVVTKDVEPYAIMAGSSAKLIRYRFDESKVEKLLLSKWWEFAPWQLKGTCMDDIDRFVDDVLKLRSEQIAAYAPEKISLSEWRG